jgi:hypothetical protein
VTTINNIKEWLFYYLYRSYKNAIKIHKRNLKKDSGVYILLGSLFIYLILSWSLINSDIKIGLSFIFSGFIAIYTGAIYKYHNVIGYVLVGCALASVIIPTFLGAWESFQGGDWIGALIVFVFGIILWIYSNQMKSGKPPYN